MSSSATQVDVSTSAITKMKVADLKKELKARGLSAVGTKNELVERLQSASSQGAQDLISEDGNVESEILDEDEVLAGGEEEGGEFDDDDLTADAVLADEPKVKPTTAASIATKRPAPLANEASQEVQPKKRILVRPMSVLSSAEKENSSQEKTTNEEDKESKTDEDGKKVVKISGVSVKERLELRAQKFGVPLSESAKKEARAARFGGTPIAGPPQTTSTKITIMAPSEELLKKRAERFGVNVSSIAVKAEEKEKLKKRQERFGLSATTVENLDEKKKLRAERFKLK